VVGLHAGEIVYDGAPGDLDDAALALIYQPALTPAERRHPLVVAERPA
jgi:ABC-type phosphate/phosphonate transport system ATPase subunit